MGNTNNKYPLLPLQRFERHEKSKLLLINGYCRSILCQLYDSEQFNFNVITCIIIKHYDYTINSSIQSLSKYLTCADVKNDDYYLNISLFISQMLIESHHLIHKQFLGSTKKNGLKSHNNFPDDYYESKLDEYLNGSHKLKNMLISRMDFVDKLRSINKSQPLCPCKTIDNYSFSIYGDSTSIYNGNYRRCLSFADTIINDYGEVPLITDKKYDKLEFGNRLNIWLHEDDMIDIGSSISFIPNTRLKYIRCLSRDQYNSTHCYWRLHCLKLNNNGKLMHLKCIGQDKMDENGTKCIQYLAVVHQWRQRNGGASSKEILPQYYEYPCGRHTVWRKLEGISSVSVQLELCHNQFCTILPQLNNLGSSCNTIQCQLLDVDSKIFWNNKFIKCIKKNINYNDNKNEAKLIYYFTVIWLNQLIYKVALDHGFNFKKINKLSVAPHFYYQQNWNPLARHLQKHIFKGRIKYYGKDIYFKNISSSNSSNISQQQNTTNSIKIADEQYIIQTVDEWLKCLRLKLQNKQNKNNNDWIKRLNQIQLTPNYKPNKAKLIKK